LYKNYKIFVLIKPERNRDILEKWNTKKKSKWWIVIGRRCFQKVLVLSLIHVVHDITQVIKIYTCSHLNFILNYYCWNWFISNQEISTPTHFLSTIYLFRRFSIKFDVTVFRASKFKHEIG